MKKTVISRFVALTSACVMVIGFLTGCGKTAEVNEDVQPSESVTSTAETAASEEAVAATDRKSVV